MTGSRDRENAVRATFPADQTAPGTAIALVHRVADAAGLCAGLRARLAVVVEELVVNIVEHGRPDPASPIELRLTPGPEGVEVALIDAGAAHDPSAGTADPAQIEQRGGGAGLGLVRAWSRIRSYRRRNGRNELTLLVGRQHP